MAPKFFSKWIRVIGFVMIALMVAETVQASHLVGGELSYVYLGDGKYKIVLKIRRDCINAFPEALFDDPASIGIFDSDYNLLTDLGDNGQFLIPFNGDDTVNQVLINPCTVSSSDVCVHETIYEQIVELPFRQGGYIFTYQRCCRNVTLSNVADPLNSGMTLTIHLTEEALLNGNSSPQFVQWAPLFICAGEKIDFDHSATDVDGDSLVYNLCAPFLGGERQTPRPQPPTGGPYERINWSSDLYGVDNMLGSSVPLEADLNTGRLTGVPENIGQYIVGIRVDEYRGGQLISSVKRDFQYNVRDCNDDIRAIYGSPDAFCGDLTITFENSSINSNFTQWFFDYPDNLSATSSDENPTYTFPEYGTYTIALITGFDSICFDTLLKEITIFDGKLIADFDYEPQSCGDNLLDIQLIDLSADEVGTVESWEWTITYDEDTVSATGAMPTVQVRNGALVTGTLHVTSSSGCESTFTKQFIANFFKVELLADSVVVCQGDTTLINPFKNEIPENVNFQWDSSSYLIAGTDQISPTFFSGELGPVTLYFTADNGNGCFYSDSMVANVLYKPQLEFEINSSCGNPTVGISNLTPDADVFFWNFGTGQGDTMIVTKDFEFTFPTSGVYDITLRTTDGCAPSIVQQITIRDDSELGGNASGLASGCPGDVVELNSGANPFFEYSWSPADLVSDPNSPNPTATVVDTPINFTVEIKIPGSNNCITIRDIALINVIDLELAKIKDTINACPGDPVALNPNGSENFNFTWSPAELLDDANAVNPMATIDESTIFTVTITDPADPNCTGSKNVLVRIGVEEILESIQDTVETCFNRETELNPNGDSNFVYQWSPAELFDDPTAVNPTISVDTHTLIHVIVTDSINGNCSAEKDVQIWIPVLDATNQINDTILACFGNPVELNPNGNSRFSYEWTPDSGLSSTTATNPIATVSETSKFYVTVIDSITDCSNIDSLIVFVPPIFSLEVNTQDTTLCSGSELDLIATISGETELSIEWVDIEGMVISNNDTITVTPESTTNYTINVTDEFGCLLSESIVVTPGQVNTDISVDAPMTVICSGDEVTLTVINNNPDQELMYMWEEHPSITSELDGAQITINATEPTDYIVKVSNDLGCMATDTISVDVKTFIEDVSATATPPSIILGQTSQLEATQNSTYAYMWDPSSTLNNGSIHNPEAKPTETTTYTVKVTNSDGCMQTVDVQVEVIIPDCEEPYLFIPNAFTPNNDGENDVLFVRGNTIDEMELLIYNRYGQQVFKSTSQSSGWDGRHNNKEVHPDVYGFYLWIRCDNGDIFTKKGNVTVLR